VNLRHTPAVRRVLGVRSGRKQTCAPALITTPQELPLLEGASAEPAQLGIEASLLHPYKWASRRPSPSPSPERFEQEDPGIIGDSRWRDTYWDSRGPPRRVFQATALDPVVSEAQKQARLGWSTVHMARHYTDAISDEDRRAAEHIGEMLGEPLKALSSSEAPSRRSAVRFYRPGAAETTSASSSRSTARRGI